MVKHLLSMYKALVQSPAYRKEKGREGEREAEMKEAN